MSESRHVLNARKIRIESSLATLFERVDNALVSAMEGLGGGDAAACERVVKADAELNAMRQRVEQDCLLAIVSQQPVAHDLRDLLADMRMASELERMGDHASGIAFSLRLMDGAGLDRVGLATAMEMSRICRRMLSDARAAHEGSDTAMARGVGAMDDPLDALMRQMEDQVMAAMRADAALVNNGARMLRVAQHLERFGDRATNLAELTLFRVEGVIEELD